MKRRTPITVLSVCCFACAHASPDPQPTPHPSIFQFAPQNAQYLRVIHRTVRQDVAGLESTTSTTLRYIVSAEVSQGSTASDVRFIIDSIVGVEGDGFDRAQVSAARGATFEAHMSPSGRVTDLPEASSDQSLLIQIHSSLSQFFPIIPEAGLIPGVAWVDTTRSTRRNGRTQIQIDAIVESAAGDWQDSENGTTLTITWRSSYTLTGEGEQLGRHFTIQGTGITSGHSRVAADGAFLSTLSADSSNAEVLVQDLGYSIPVIQSGVDTLSLIR